MNHVPRPASSAEFFSGLLKRSFLGGWSRRRADAHDFFAAAEVDGAMAYMHPHEMQQRGYCATWTFAMVVKNDCTLAYRVGRYRDDRDNYAKRRLIGFSGPLTIEDATLFSRDHLGAEDCAIAVLMQDLDLSLASFQGDGKQRPMINDVMVVEVGEALDVVIVLTWQCPEWFEPTTRRMSINDPHWLCTSVRHNDLEDFEPWSSTILAAAATDTERTVGGDETDLEPAGRIPDV